MTLREELAFVRGQVRKYRAERNAGDRTAGVYLGSWEKRLSDLERQAPRIVHTTLYT